MMVKHRSFQKQHVGLNFPMDLGLYGQILAVIDRRFRVVEGAAWISEAGP